MFSKALTLANSDTHSDPSLGNGSCLELDIVPCAVLIMDPLVSCMSSLYNDKQDWEADNLF